MVGGKKAPEPANFDLTAPTDFAPIETVPTAQLPNVTFAQGAIVIRAGSQIIGSIGVSGAPGGQFDEACAREALVKIQDKIK